MNNKSDDDQEEGEDEDKEEQKQQEEEETAGEEEDARSISTITFSQKHALMLTVRLPVAGMAIISSWSQDCRLFVLAVLIDITTATNEWQTIQLLNKAGVSVICHFHDALSIFHAWGRSCKFLTRPCNWP